MRNPVKIIQNLPILEDRINNVSNLIEEKKSLINQWGVSKQEEVRAQETIKRFQAQKSYLVRKYTSDYKFISGL